MRQPLARPFTKPQAKVVKLVGQGHSFLECAPLMAMSYRGVLNHARAAAKKIPGDLPLQAKLLAWSRGATKEVLGV